MTESRSTTLRAQGGGQGSTSRGILLFAETKRTESSERGICAAYQLRCRAAKVEKGKARGGAFTPHSKRTQEGDHFLFHTIIIG